LRYFLEKFILKRKRDNLIRESYVFEIDTSAIKNFQENLFDNTAFTGIPRTFHDDLNQVSLKTEKAISDIKQLQAFISQKESNKV